MAYQPSHRMRPLNVGDVVSAGISLLRTHFKTYLGLSLKAALWYLIPIYGWARGLMIFAQIGRLGFQEIIHQPETPKAALRKVEPRMWSFLGVAILVTIIQLAINYAISAASSVLIVPLVAIGSAGTAAAGLSGILIVLAQILIFVAQTWIQARFLVYDMIIAMEPDTDATASISRSFELTKGSAIRVMFVLLITYLVVAPLYLLSLVPFLFTIPFFTNSSGAGGGDVALGIVAILASLAFLVLLFLAIALAVPFFQAIKAVVYYDLRSRREGLDIQLDDRPRDRDRP